MIATLKHKLAMLFAIFFIVIVAAPSVILSIDDKIDISLFAGENEEEEKENLKLLFDISFDEVNSDDAISANHKLDFYVLKRYTKPSINLISPPPDLII